MAARPGGPVSTRGSTPVVHLGRSEVVDRGYAVLAAVDLGRDAANLYDAASSRAQAAAPAIERLRGALLAHPGDALVLQGWPLRAATLATLAAPPVAPALATAWAGAVATHGSPASDPPERVTAAFDRLPALLAALWAPLGPAAPGTCRVLDCPPLGRHGRALAHGDAFVVATSASAGLGWHPLMQVFHEAAHPVTDAPVLARLGSGAAAARRTAAGSAGFEVHRALESTAVAYGTTVIEGHAPDLLPAWQAWCRDWVYSG